MTRTRTIFVLAIASLALGVAGAAMAQAPVTRTQAVKLADLDLSRAADRATLERRLARAAAWVCPDGYSRERSLVRDVAQCRGQALAAARERLATLYDGHAPAQASTEVGPGKR